MNESKKYGIIAGVATIGYMLLFYFIDRALILDMKVYWSPFLIYFFCMYKACMEIRNRNENEVLHLAEGLKASFQVFLIANALFYVFYYVMLNYVDPGLIEMQKEIAAQYYELYLPEEQAKKTLQKMEEVGFDMTIRTTIFEYAKGAMAGFVFSLLIAAITRQE